ncbi:hypothetical protein AAFC00_002877 [Neodothiora populina]|uniref:Uncharacterized protein n=1 Tax=Neodothiora populina TaxID=2781224 RepID=A0ABR3P8I5_9PEZI
MPSEAPARRFDPIPTETSSRSNRSPPADDAKMPQPAPRKFAVEPVETSKNSNRGSTSSSSRAPRKFSAQPFETTAACSTKAPGSSKNTKSRLNPKPFETSTSSNRKTLTTEASPSSDSALAEKPARRRFTPELIATSQRSRKPVEAAPTFSDEHKTDFTPNIVRPSYNNSGQQVAPIAVPPKAHDMASRILRPFERRNERTLSQGSGRSHSFRMPDLETIESSESEERSNPPSISSSPSQDGSPLTTSDSAMSEMYKHATRIRESVDESVANYMLMIEAKRAEEKLREQALAAFPNSDFHEPVAHYVADVESDSDSMEIDDRPATWDGHDEDDYIPARRTSTHGNWELQEMRAHHERREQERNAASTTARRTSTTTKSPWWTPGVEDYVVASQNDPEMRKMRDQARPPMLGADIRFPRSASPEPARFDVTQGSQRLRHQMCYLSEQSDSQNDADGLWGAQLHKTSTRGSAQASTHSQGQGLWGGFCVDEHKDQPNGLNPHMQQLQTGLMTPAVESGNPFERMHHPSDIQAPVPVPPSIVLPLSPSESDSINIDSVLKTEKDLDDLMASDYPDTFVTQVYNYLSLGYPTLARPFDEELAKISGVPISELRHDDDIAKSMPKGYIRLGDDFEGRGDGIDQELQSGGCARWKALKLYIREWARQEKNMVRKESIGDNWGTGARRGSWAF